MALTFFSVIPAATLILWIFSFFLILYAGYYTLISLFAFKPVAPVKSFPPRNKFAILIAARNEARVVGNLIDSLKNQNYPSELYEIFVIPNRCVDDTSAVAFESGASVLARRFETAEGLEYGDNDGRSRIQRIVRPERYQDPLGPTGGLL